MTLSILIADDHDVVRRGMRTLIEGRREWQVCGEAVTGSEAIERSVKLRPDMLLLDLTLPDMDAANAITEIIKVCPEVKIVVLATQDSAELTANALAAGALGLAMKSDAANDLLATLESIGNNQPFLSPAAVRLLQDQLARSSTSEAGPHDLTVRELEILKLRARGWTNKAIAKSLDISVKTVDAHRTNFMRKLRLATYSDLIRFAIQHDLMEC
jgi:DNA-binding NarL/FixJ family response regulator